jgi:hypothetical protein
MIFNRTRIDRWFLTQIKEIVDFVRGGPGMGGKLMAGNRQRNSCHVVGLLLHTNCD